MPAAARRTLVASLALALAVASEHAPIASANPTPGFVEHWTTGNGGFGGGATYSNPGTGGQLGAGDGFFQMSTPGPAPFNTLNLGTQSASANYTGNWQAAGIQKVKLWLNDVGNANPLEIHFALGTNGATQNFWQFDTGFIPPAGSWAQFTVDLTSSTGWTQIIASPAGGTFDQALQSVSNILIRHDRAPYVQTPDTIHADVGLDELELQGSSTGVPRLPAGVSQPVALAPAAPNPARDQVGFAIEAFDAAPIRIEVVDASGRRVRQLTLDGGAGRHAWRWDGRTDAGGPAAAGVYRARAWSTSGGTSRSFVWLGGGR